MDPMEFKLFQLVPERGKYLVSGYIRSLQRLLPSDDNPYYIIPLNVIRISTIYYSISLHVDNRVKKDPWKRELITKTYVDSSKHCSRMDGKIDNNSVDLILNNLIIIDQSKCLNCLNSNALSQIIQSNDDDNIYLASDPDIDGQIIIKLVLSEVVHLTHIKIKASMPPQLDGYDDDDIIASEPRLIKLFMNRQELDFEDADNLKCTQQIVLDKKKLKGKKVLLKPKFKKCSSLQIYIVDNQKGTQFTYLNRLTIIGNK